MSELLVVVGPTASGKTELAIDLAEELGGEIVSADSVQVYRHFDIGTGKPSAEERARAPHHLIDVVEPFDTLDAASFAERAEQLIDEIRARRRTPIVCGGTFLWVRALIYGLAEAPPGDPVLRERYRERAEREGRASLHAELSRVDPASAARLAPNDFVRVSRALEVFELTGTPLSVWQAQHGFREKRHPARLIGPKRSKDELDERIHRRVTAMFQAGFVEEVRELRARGYEQARAMASVGYRQVNEAVAAGGPVDVPALRDAVVRATRVFARRQRTWLRDEPVEWR